VPRINLLNRKKQQLQRKTASEGIVYLIKTHQNNKSYYVHKVDRNTNAIVWTSVRHNAMVFHTETGTQHFVHTYLKNRKDIELIGTRSTHA